MAKPDIKDNPPNGRRAQKFRYGPPITADVSLSPRSFRPGRHDSNVKELPRLLVVSLLFFGFALIKLETYAVLRVRELDHPYRLSVTETLVQKQRLSSALNSSLKAEDTSQAAQAAIYWTPCGDNLECGRLE